MARAWHEQELGLQAEPILWELFHENTKLSRLCVGRSEEEMEKHVEGLLESFPFKGYPITKLPKRMATFKMRIGQAMNSRSSAREMHSRTVRLEKLATILHYGYGITRRTTNNPRGFRAVPSAGALFPLEIFVQVRRVQSLTQGLYHYNPQGHHLRMVREGEDIKQLQSCFAQDTIPANASFLIFITALFERSTFKYGDRGYRFVFLEAGHVAQNISIVCSALRLASLSIGGFFDREIDRFLVLDGITHSTIYVIAVGSQAQSPKYHLQPLE